MYQHLKSTLGWRGLFSGYIGVQARQASWTAAYFGTLSTFQDGTTDGLKLIASDPTSKGWTQISQIVSGFGAGTFGAIFNVPADIVRTGVQKAALSAEPGSVRPFPFTAVGEAISVGVSVASGPAGIAGLWTGFPFKAAHLGGSGDFATCTYPPFHPLPPRPSLTSLTLDSRWQGHFWRSSSLCSRT